MKRYYKVISVHALLNSVAEDQRIIIRDHAQPNTSWNVACGPYKTVFEGVPGKCVGAYYHKLRRTTVLGLSVEDKCIVADVCTAQEEY